MTTQTTTPKTPNTPTTRTPKGLTGIPENTGRALTTGGGILTAASTFLAWTWTAAFPGNLTVYGYPGGLQVLVLIGATLTALFSLASYGIKGLRWLAPAGTDSAIKLSALGTFATAWFTIIAISIQLGGLVNLEPGGCVVALATLTTLLGALSLPFTRPEPEPVDPDDTRWEQLRHHTRNNTSIIKAAFASRTATPARNLPASAEILIIVAALALGLTVFTYGIGTEYDELFIGFLITAGFGFAALAKAGLIDRLSALTAKHRNVTMIGAFVAAALFPFTQIRRPIRNHRRLHPHLRHRRPRPQHRRRPRRPPRPRIRRLPRRRRLHRRHGLRLPLLPLRHPPPLLGLRPHSAPQSP